MKVKSFLIRAALVVILVITSLSFAAPLAYAQSMPGPPGPGKQEPKPDPHTPPITCKGKDDNCESLKIRYDESTILDF